MSEFVMNTIKTFKNNVIPVVSGVLTILSILVGAVVAIDSRYALSEEFNNYKESTQSQLIRYQNQIQAYHEDNRIRMLDARSRELQDKIFELELNRNHSTADNALLHRWRSELQEIAQRKIEKTHVD